MAKTLAVFTGGGHAAGLNAGIAGVTEEIQLLQCQKQSTLPTKTQYPLPLRIYWDMFSPFSQFFQHKF